MIIQYSMQIVNRLRASPRPEEQIFLPNDEKWPPLPFRGPKDRRRKAPSPRGPCVFIPREPSFLKSLPRGGFPSASSQRSKFRKPLRSSRLCSDARSSRAVEPALGQGMPRTMGHSQVRKWSKPHRGFDKEALAHPLPAKLAARLLREPFS